jgi:hypothetical protein
MKLTAALAGFAPVTRNRRIVLLTIIFDFWNKKDLIRHATLCLQSCSRCWYRTHLSSDIDMEQIFVTGCISVQLSHEVLMFTALVYTSYTDARRSEGARKSKPWLHLGHSGLRSTRRNFLVTYCPPLFSVLPALFYFSLFRPLFKKNVFVPNPHGDGCGTRKWAESTRLTSPWSNASRYGLFHLDHPSHPCDRRPLLVSVAVDTEPRRTRRRARSQPIAAGEARIRGWRARDRGAAGGRTERSPS